MQTINFKSDIPFSPAGILKNNHFQTIFPALFFHPSLPPNTDKLVLKTEEKTVIMCDKNLAAPKNDQCVILVHGLEGSSTSYYVVSTAKKLLKNGFDTIRMNMRNCGNTFHLTDTMYSAGLTHDLDVLIRHCIDDLKYKNIYLVGFSLGANLVLKLAGEFSAAHPAELKGICAVSPPCDLSESSREIIKSKNKVYNLFFLTKMKDSFTNKNRYFPELYDLSVLKKINNLFDFDNLVTAKNFNYQDADDYYAKNSSLNFIENIRLNTLIIHAKDDPIIPFSALKKATEIKNPAVSFLITDYGGHVGFLNDLILSFKDQDFLWAENRIVDFIKKI